MKSLKNAIPEHLKRCVHDEVLHKSTFYRLPAFGLLTMHTG